MNVTEVPALVKTIASLWPNAPTYTEAHLEAFYAVLEPVPSDAVRAALVSLSREGRPFPPNAGELYRRSEDLVAPTPDATAAWAEVIAWVRAHGRMDPPTPESFSHPAVWDALNRCGYGTLCASGADDEKVWFAHFRRCYEAAVTDSRLAEPRAVLGAGAVRAALESIVHRPEDA